jgi:outer membrane protein OmpA-like peptidoglycan-associated protein
VGVYIWYGGPITLGEALNETGVTTAFAQRVGSTMGGLSWFVALPIAVGFYFDFAGAVIKPESEPVLKAIAGVMEKHPAWKLNVEGHTDNIGGDEYNLELSKQRAAAVKAALVARYHVAADRLATAGYGASRPKDTNDTLEGRARNRRVELVRQ